MTNSVLSLDSLEQTRALLSIKPAHVDAIVRGVKRYEFRRRIFSRNVDIIVVYATMPIGRVVGEFDVGTIHRDSLSRLWAKTSQFSGIDREYFYSYFDGLDTGYAIEIGDFRNYGKQLSPLEAYGINPPQSFAYIE